MLSSEDMRKLYCKLRSLLRCYVLSEKGSRMILKKYFIYFCFFLKAFFRLFAQNDNSKNYGGIHAILNHELSAKFVVY